MTDEIRHSALARDIARRLPAIEIDALRVIDHVVTRLELGRERYGDLNLAAPRDWSRELAEEQIDAVIYAAARELAAQDMARESLREAARREMLGERCCASSHTPPDAACRGFGLGGNGRCVYCDHERRCHPGPGATCEIGSGENGFAPDQHATKIGGPDPYESVDVEIEDLGGEA